MILLAIKNPDYCTKLRINLEKEGYEVITSDSEKEAENIINRTTPELAIFELKLEYDDSGITLGYKLKKIKPEIPVIIVAPVNTGLGIKFGYLSEEDKKWIKADVLIERESGIDNYIETIRNLLES